MKVIIFIFVFFNISMSVANAGFRDRLKQRFVEKQKKQPAPSTDPIPATIDKAGDYTFSIQVADKTRFYKLHVPQNYKHGQAMPVLVVLHGGGGNMSIPSTDELYHLISKSESRGFIALFPNGPSQFQSGKLATWNAGRCCGQARDTKSDDVNFIKEMIKKTQKQLSIDSQRIFATGMSNGGMMSYRLACEMTDTFRAIAAVAGTDNTESCQPSKPISILHIHAKNDDHVLFDGGAGKGAFPNPSTVTDFISVPKTIEKWKKFDGCSSPAKRILDKKNVYCDRYENCKEHTSIQLCVTEDGGHSWPGGKKPSGLLRSKASKPSNAISATDVMWNFFDSL